MAALNIGRADRIPEGEAIVIDAAEAGTKGDIAIFHAEDGEFYALDDTCTHETASLADGWIEGTEVECPIHSAKFCLKTGAALCMPATVDVATHRIEREGDDLILHPGEAVTA